jgi:hypothetical protein
LPYICKGVNEGAKGELEGKIPMVPDLEREKARFKLKC